MISIGIQENPEPNVSNHSSLLPPAESLASLFWIHLPPPTDGPSQWPLVRQPGHLLLRNAGTAVSAKDGPTDEEDLDGDDDEPAKNGQGWMLPINVSFNPVLEIVS